MVRELAKGSPVWIGGYRGVPGGKLKWADGSEWGYEIWQGYFSDPQVHLWVNMTPLGGWNDSGYATYLTFVCEYQL